MLYAQRFFPYYVYNILGGIEEDGMLNPFFSSCQAGTQLRRYQHAGTGAVYSFDPVGSYEREACRAAGAAQSLVQPLLDNQVSYCIESGWRFPMMSRITSFPVLSPTCLRLFAGHLVDFSFLDQIYFKNQTAAQGFSHPAHLPLTDVLSIVIDSFTGATERHIEVQFYLFLA